MPINEIPYFLTNEKWYKEVSLADHDRGYILTDEAPPEAVKSYNEFYAEEYIEEDGDLMVIRK